MNVGTSAFPRTLPEMGLATFGQVATDTSGDRPDRVESDIAPDEGAA